MAYADPSKLRPMALDLAPPQDARTSITLEDVHEWLEWLSDAMLSVSDYQAEVQGMLSRLTPPCKEDASIATECRGTKMFNDLSDVEHRRKCREYAIGFSGPFESQAHRIAIEWYRRPESGQDPDTLAGIISAEIEARLIRERREMRTKIGEGILRRLGLSQRQPKINLDDS